MFSRFLQSLIACLCLAVVLAPEAWAVDPVSVHVNTPGGPLVVTVVPNSWSVDSTTGLASGSGTHVIVFAGHSTTLEATWTDVGFDAPTKTLTSGTIALAFASGPITGSVGVEVTLFGLSLDAATGNTTISGGEIHAPATDGGIGLGLSESIDLTGSMIVLSPSGLTYLSCTTTAPISVLGVKLAVGALLQIDCSDTAASPNGTIPSAHIGSPADGGVAWRGFHLSGATVAFGAATPAAGAATLTYLGVGWPGPSTSTAPDFRGEITASLASPLHGELFGIVAELTSGTLLFDSTLGAGGVSGSFGGSITVPGSGGPSTWMLGPHELSVSYGAPFDFALVVEHTFVTPEGFTAGGFAAHVKHIGVDASPTEALPSAASLTADEQALTWTGLVIFEGDLEFPVPGTHDGSVLALGMANVVVPFSHPGQFDGWFRLQGGVSSPPAALGNLALQFTDSPPPGLAPVVTTEMPSDPTTAASVAGHTHLHFLDGHLASGCLYGLLKIPNTPDVPFGAVVDADGNLIGAVTVPEITIGQGEGEIRFSNVQATLDLSQSSSPSPSSAPPPAGWTGLVIDHAEVTLPWPFSTPSILSADDLLWDHGLSGTIALSAVDAGSLVVVRASDSFDVQLQSFALRFAHGGIVEVTASGSLQANPFLDDVGFTIEYDAASGFVLKADVDGGVHAFGGSSGGSGSGGALQLTFTALEIEIPTRAANASGALVTLRMDGSVHVGGPGVPGFDFENVQLRSDGTVNAGGAWIDLREHGHWEFQKFGVDVREIGFGSVPSATGAHQVWIGVSGGLSLSDMWGMSLDIQANKFRWFQDHGFSVEEVKLDATVKETVHIQGKVKFLESATKREFRGQIDVQVAVASGTFAAGIQFVSGHLGPFAYWGVAGRFQLPTAVPLGSTGLALYGVNGGVSKGLTPSATSINIYDWDPDPASGFAFQAGVTIGTYADTGYTLHAGVTMTVLLEPLIIRIDGTGTLLTSMSDVSNLDRIVKASIVYDSSTQTFDASLELGQSNAQPFIIPHILAVRGLAVLHIEETRAYLHVGTKSAPITARVFPDLGGGITASTWFTVDWYENGDPQPGLHPNFVVSVGAYVGWNFYKHFKICDVTGAVAAGGEVTVALSPFGFDGSLSASVGAQACGVGFLLAANANASYHAVFHLHADCTLRVNVRVKTISLPVAVDLP